ncbi:hypothetical protein NF556_05195 [Ornithinimicrobium faecis]|uniref:Uncharacterized protein n=1 Tax=Ornithinimicrobium faecis TaxID=2934158 RepID=A0ABY4YX68_9MICO|nr:hypothetical protein [Ornithinimicrobium sp. HY1793]USQ81045.1 hypothetical protein NF556_05195 [Ornithinimicrobium sp. HY1793]
MRAPSSLRGTAPVRQGPHRPDLAIAWKVPAPRPGWRGAVDRFFGPGPTRVEVLVQLCGIPILGVLVLAHVASVGVQLHWWGVIALAIFTIDALGGVLTNSTGAAKRWYHRPGTRGERLRFVSLHVVHLALIAILVLDQQWGWLALNAVLLLGLALLIEHTPLPVRRPVAMGALVAAALLSATLVPVPDGLGWIAPLLFLKLLVAHLIPEAPFASVDDATTA